MRRLFIILFTLAVLALAWSVTPPSNFPRDSIIEIPEGSHLPEILKILEDNHLIRFPFLFKLSALVLGDKKLQAGQYYFEKGEMAPIIAWRIARGIHGIKTVKLTIPEGFTVKEISTFFDDRFKFFDNSYFERVAPEGYLFPDTYFVPVTATVSSTIKLMTDNFSRQVKASTTKEAIIMASLLEAELKSREDREIASGILWKRLKLGMALQVDSYMWTYENVGLPAKPINNPGLVSIKAALHPTSTSYLYFLSGKDGKTYYARTHDEHVINKQKYLR